MIKKNGARKLRSLESHKRRVTTYCGTPCDLDKGHLCEDCKEWRQVIRNKAGRYEGGSGT